MTVCDAGLLGRELKEGQLRLRVDEAFYGGREASVEECLRCLRGATVANVVGSIVERAVEAGLIDPASVIKIEDVPHAQLIRM